MKVPSNPVLTGSLYPILILVAASFFIETCSGQAGIQTERTKGFPFRKQNVGLLEEPLHSSSPSHVINNDPTRPWRLPLNIIPTLYEVTLYPIMESGFEDEVGEQWTVLGISYITIVPQNNTNQIVLHMKNITVETLQIVAPGGRLQTIVGTSYDEEYMFYRIFLQDNLVAGTEYLMTFLFTSYIQTELHGLYRSSYVDPITGETKWIATSQLEALSARELFPCFDEPHFKAIFQLTIARQEKHIALTNTPLRETYIRGSWYLDEFEPTVKMSTYLVALIICEFEYAEAPGTILPGTVVRTYSPAHFIQRDGGIYAAEKGAEALAFYGEYFDQAYPLPKMDLAAVPDFFFGAMENFGLNIYREALLLYFPDESTEAERFLLTTVIAHELAHQWFGNLVSPAFWTHIWLNEGMTSFVEYIGLQAIVPEFNPHDMFLSDTLHGALAADVDTTRPLKIDENAWYTQEAMSWFDGITYDKGGSIGKMMQGFLSDSVMQLGLRRYQNRMKYSAAEQDDLFSDLSIEAEAANKLPIGYTMKDIMDTWTLQPGFPLINVTRAAQGSIQISQTRFGNDSSPNRWIVPLSVATKEVPTFDPEPEYFLLSDSLTMVETPASWVIVNAGATGYYRVKYDAYLHGLIVDQLTTDHSVIEKHTKSNLIDDHFTFAYRGISPIEDALLLTLYLGAGPVETEIAVWIAVLDNLSRPNNLFSSTPIYGNMISYLLPRLTRAIDAAGGPGAVGVDTKGGDVLRHTLLLDWACSYGDLKCLTYALTLVASWQINPTINPVPRDLKPIFYCGAISTGGEDILQFIHSQYNSTTSSKESTYLLNSLACVHDDLLINRLLNSTLQDGYFKEKSEASAFLQRLARNPIARPALVSFLGQNVQALIQYFGNTSAITGTFNALSNYMSTDEELTSLERFILENQAVLQGSLDATANRVRSNVAWVAQYGPAMQLFFAQNS